MPSFKDVYNDIWQNGSNGVGRGAAVKYLLNTSVTEFPDCFPHRRGGNPAIGLIEGLQFIAGTAELSAIKAAALNAKHELFGLSSYYGPRTASQFPRVIEELRRYPDSRRAVVSVMHPHDSPETIPCTTSLQFMLTQPGHAMLDTVVTMRSSDFVYGMPYDLIQFGMVAHAVASCLGVDNGGVQVLSGNAHIYASTSVEPREWQDDDFTVPGDFVDWEQWVHWAKSLIYRDKLLDSTELKAMFNVRG